MFLKSVEPVSRKVIIRFDWNFFYFEEMAFGKTSKFKKNENL